MIDEFEELKMKESNLYLIICEVVALYSIMLIVFSFEWSSTIHTQKVKTLKIYDLKSVKKRSSPKMLFLLTPK